MLDFTFSAIMLSPSRSTLRGRLPEASCWRGTGAAPAGDGGRNHRPRAVLGQPRRPLGVGPVRPRSKAQRQRCRVGAPQGAGRDASRPGPGDPGPPGSHALPGRSGEIQAMRLVGAPTPSPEGEAKRQECGRPPGPEPQTGADFLLTQRRAMAKCGATRTADPGFRCAPSGLRVLSNTA